MRRTKGLVAALTVTLLSGTAALAADGGIREITLSSGGLAEIIRSTPVSGAGRVEIEVPLDQVDDVLKSLVVIAGDGAVKSLSLGGLSPVEEIMRTMPFTAEDMAGLPTLLAKLQGTRVEVEGAGRTVSGAVLGVSVAKGENAAESQVLSLMSDDGGVVMVPLTAEVSVRILDKAVLDKITEAASAIGRANADGARRIAVDVVGGEGTEGAPGASVEIAYVVAAPIWKTAYRVVTDAKAGTARLQAWAVLENATGEDWKDVKLTLSSGAPVTLKQRLHERYWRQRPEVPVDIDGSPAPRPDGGAMEVAPPPPPMAALEQDGRNNMAMMAEAGRAKSYAGDAQSYSPAPIAAGYEPVAIERDTSATFAVHDPVTVAAGDTMSVPILDATVKAERIALYQPGVAGIHPVAALMLRNDTQTSLPGGILTVYDEGAGYVGDAQLLGMPAGEERMVSFAVDRKVSVDAESDSGRSILALKAVDGVLTASVKVRERTVYTVKGAADGPRDVVIEHARRPGWTFSSPAEASLTDTAHRLRVKVEAGRTERVEAIDEVTQAETMTLTDADPDYLLSWAGEAGNEGVKTELAALAAARRAVVEIDGQLSDIEGDRQRIADDQGRIRQNLAAVPPESKLARDYLAEMARQEEEFGATNVRRLALQADRKARQEALEAIIRGL